MNPIVLRKRGRPRSPELAERRREQILDIAAATFAARGYPGADIQVIADSLGIGKGTIYRYFRNKEALFLATVDRGMRLLTEEVNLRTDPLDDPLERIRAGVEAYLSYFESRPALMELLIQERAEFKDRKKPTYTLHREANVGKWRDLVRGLVRDARIRDIPPERVTDVLSDLLYGATFTNHFAGRAKTAREQAAEILDVVFHGILSEGERARASDREPKGRTGASGRARTTESAARKSSRGGAASPRKRKD